MTATTTIRIDHATLPDQFDRCRHDAVAAAMEPLTFGGVTPRRKIKTEPEQRRASPPEWRAFRSIRRSMLTHQTTGEQHRQGHQDCHT